MNNIVVYCCEVYKIMSMGDMSPEALERIVRIETKLDMLVEMIPKMQELQLAHERAAQSAKSAHHRIDNIYKVAGLISTIVSVVIALIGKVL